jgi:hypothetical protein
MRKKRYTAVYTVGLTAVRGMELTQENHLAGGFITSVGFEQGSSALAMSSHQCLVAGRSFSVDSRGAQGGFL